MTTLSYSRAGMLGGIEEVLLGSPDDLCLHQAYATALLAQGDPASAARARYIQTQIKLETATLTAEDRKSLMGREKKLLRDHGKTWLGELWGWLTREGYRFTMKRGWLDTVEAPELNAEFIALLAHETSARMVRSITITTPSPDGKQALLPLVDSPLLANLSELRVGETGAGEHPAEVLRRLVGE